MKDVAASTPSRTDDIGFSHIQAELTLPDPENLVINQVALTRRRARFMAALLSAGYSVLVPEGIFYLWSKWADSDPQRQWNALADRDAFVLPGSMMNAPDYFRTSLTASDEMVERALSHLSMWHDGQISSSRWRLP